MSFELFLVVGMLAMFFCLLYCGEIYHFPAWGMAILAVALTCIGALGAFLLGRIETGRWSARSYYGAVYLVPILMFPLALVFRLPYNRLLDISAPAGCVMLALLKVKCKIDGCCYGRIFHPAEGLKVQFPSQIVECIAALLLMAILIIMVKKGKWTGKIYPWYMVLYGVSRFVLNFFRETTPWIGPLSSGAFWSLIAIVSGSIALIVLKRKDKMDKERKSLECV